MIPCYFLAAVFFFDWKSRENSKGIVESSGSSGLLPEDLGISDEFSKMSGQGNACLHFYKRAPTLCSILNSKREKLDLCILMGNCELEKNLLEPLSFSNNRDVDKATDDELALLMLMHDRLPHYCSNATKQGLNLNFWKMDHTINMINTTKEKLEEITRITIDFEDENKKAVAAQEKLLQETQKYFNESKSISESSRKMKQSIESFRNSLDSMKSSLTGLKRITSKQIRNENETEAKMLNFMRRAKQMIEDMDVTTYATRETELAVKVMQYQLLLVVIIALYALFQSSASLITILIFLIRVSLVTAVSSMHFGGFILMYNTVKSVDMNEAILIVTSFLVVYISLFAFPALRRIALRKRPINKEPIQIISKTAQFYNSKDVLDLLRTQETYIIQQQEKLEELLKMTQIAIEISKGRQPEEYGLPVVPVPDFARQVHFEGSAPKFRTRKSNAYSSTASYETDVSDASQYENQTMDLVDCE